MTNLEQERWSRVKGRLKAEVGEDIFSSWFARMDLESLEKDTAKLSVPTRFLKSLDSVALRRSRAALLAGGRARRAAHRTHGTLGSDQDARRQGSRAKTPAEAPREHRAEKRERRGNARCDLVGRRRYRLAHEASGGSPLDLAPDLRHLRARPLQYADACGRQAGRKRRGAAIS